MLPIDNYRVVYLVHESSLAYELKPVKQEIALITQIPFMGGREYLFAVIAESNFVPHIQESIEADNSIRFRFTLHFAFMRFEVTGAIVIFSEPQRWDNLKYLAATLT